MRAARVISMAGRRAKVPSGFVVFTHAAYAGPGVTGHSDQRPGCQKQNVISISKWGRRDWPLAETRESVFYIRRNIPGAYGGAMIRPNRRSAVLASLFLCCVGLGAVQESQASPIAYQFQIASDVWTCGRLRPAGQACPTALSGTLTVDSAQSGFASQFVDFSLQMGTFQFTRDQLSASGFASSTLSFDG